MTDPQTPSSSAPADAAASAFVVPASFTDPLTAFGVGDLTWDGAVGGASAQLSVRYADHRGRIEMPGVAVLFDDLAGVPYFRSQTEGTTLQARLSMSALGRIGVEERMSGRSQVRISEGGYGVTTIELDDAAGQVKMLGTARNVFVGRATTDDPATRIAVQAPSAPQAYGAVLPEPIDPALAGSEVIAQIASGDRAIGPIGEMLGGRIELRDGGGLRLTAVTESWMSNFLGTMHGGVIATIVGQALSFAGQVHTAPGIDYQLAEMAIGFYRSPAVDGGPVVVEVEPVKLGRRISSFEATMAGADGKLLSRATADVVYAAS